MSASLVLKIPLMVQTPSVLKCCPFFLKFSSINDSGLKAPQKKHEVIGLAEIT